LKNGPGSLILVLKIAAILLQAGGSVDASFVATGVQLTNANLDRPVTDWRILSERRFAAS